MGLPAQKGRWVEVPAQVRGGHRGQTARVLSAQPLAAAPEALEAKPAELQVSVWLAVRAVRLAA